MAEQATFQTLLISGLNYQSYKSVRTKAQTKFLITCRCRTAFRSKCYILNLLCLESSEVAQSMIQALLFKSVLYNCVQCYCNTCITINWMKLLTSKESINERQKHPNVNQTSYFVHHIPIPLKTKKFQILATMLWKIGKVLCTIRSWFFPPTELFFFCSLELKIAFT